MASNLLIIPSGESPEAFRARHERAAAVLPPLMAEVRRIHDLLNELRLPDGDASALRKSLGTFTELDTAIVAIVETADAALQSLDWTLAATARRFGVAVPSDGTVYERAAARRTAAVGLASA